LKIGIIGDEPAGPVLAKAWALAGHSVIGAAVTTPVAIDRIEALLPDVPINSMPSVAEDADVVLLAVPHDDVDLVCDGLADLGLFGPKKIVIHLSPLRGYGALSSAGLAGAVPIALNPVMHFTGTSVDLMVLKNCTVAYSAPETYQPIAQALAIELGAEPILVSEPQRAAYAEAFEVAAGFSSLVVKQAIGILEEAGVESASRLIGPVVRSAVEEALANPQNPIDPQDVL
jgi:predicted short-subunit dehydrogenase-like oxidoreductase (DUF2520 family)